MAERVNVDELIAQERAKLQERMDRGLMGELERSAGLTARSLGPLGAGMTAGALMGAPFGGVGAIPGAIAGGAAAVLAEPIADLAVTAWNAATGQNRPMPSQAIQQLMTSAGLPQPETPTERVMSTTTRAAGEALTGAGAARNVAQALSPVLNPVARPVMQTLATSPGMQTTSAALGGGATQAALEAGAPAGVAVPAGLVAGTLPMLRPGAFLPSTGGEVRAGNVQALEQAGIPLTPGQVSGNPSAQTFESVMRYLPTSAPTVARVEDQQMRAFTQNILRQAGIDSDIATPEVLSKARQDFSKRYDALEAKTSLNKALDQKLFDDLLAIEQGYVVGFPDTVKPVYKSRVDEVLKYAAGEKGADGKTYHRLQSELSEDIARATRSTEPSAGRYAEALRGLQTALGDAMERAAPEGVRDEWRGLNRQYAIFSRVEDTMARAGQDKLNTGFIPPQQIAAVERVRNPRAFVEGGDPFTDFVRAGAAVLPDPVPNSGTAQRTFMQDLVTGGRRGAPVAAAGGAAQASGLAVIDPLLSLALPYGIAKSYYGQPIIPQMQGLLGLQALGGALQAE